MFNLFAVQPGQKVRLKSGAICEVIENIGDGMWLELRTPSLATDPAQLGEPELVHCEEMVGLVEPAAT